MADAESIMNAIGMTPAQVKATLKNKKLTAKLMEVLASAKVGEDGCAKEVGNLLYDVAAKLPDAVWRHHPLLARYVMEGKLRGKDQVAEAVSYLRKHEREGAVDAEALEAAAGVGVVVTPEDVSRYVAEAFERHRALVERERYCFNAMALLRTLREGLLKWADGKTVKDAVDAKQLELLGPMTDADRAAVEEKKAKGKKGKGKKEKQKGGGKKAAAAAPDSGAASASAVAVAEGARFSARELKSAVNSDALLREHEEVTGGAIRTRFPPEPNGYLHIGHAKSMFLNFRGAFERVGKAGECIFRFDDTNPEAESEEYIQSLKDTVAWMGWKPARVTHSSDYFHQLYDLAVELIKRGKAYVCHQTKEEMARSRDLARTHTGNPESPWRNRSVEENLREFERMRMGLHAEGTATLRMRMDWTSPNPNFWDPVAYRIKFVAHPHVGDTWCIYPSYDFTHCLVDSLEHIDYSLCTLEFESRRDSYYWLLEALDMWRPYVWEFARLNLSNTMMSKRRLLAMVKEGTMRGWDDPRMPTLMAMRRRGYPPEAINNFCHEISVSRTNNTTVDMQLLEHHIRTYLNEHAPRAMAVLDPLPVRITNLEGGVRTVEALHYPNHPERGSRPVPYQSLLFIDRADFRMEDHPKYFGLAPGKIVGLRYADAIRCTGVETDAEGNATALTAEVVPKEEAANQVDARGKKRKASYIHWVAASAPGQEPPRAEVRTYNELFTAREPAAADNWRDILNPDSEIITRTAMIPEWMTKCKPGDRFQFERTGYYCIDTDSSEDAIVLNRTVALRESSDKKFA